MASEITTIVIDKKTLRALRQVRIDGKFTSYDHLLRTLLSKLPDIKYAVEVEPKATNDAYSDIESIKRAI